MPFPEGFPLLFPAESAASEPYTQPPHKDLSDNPDDGNKSEYLVKEHPKSM